MAAKVRHCPVCGEQLARGVPAWTIWCSDRCRAARHTARDAAAKTLEPPAVRDGRRDVKPQKKTDAPRPASAGKPSTPVGTSPAGAFKAVQVPPGRRPCSGPGCDQLAKPPARTGPPPAYCSRSCQNRAYIARKTGKAPQITRPAAPPRAPDPPPAPPLPPVPAVGPGRAQPELVALARAAVAWGKAVLASAGADA